jgi:hypothetical protein
MLGVINAFQWSSEGTQDFSVFHNIDAEAELTALLSKQHLLKLTVK